SAQSRTSARPACKRRSGVWRRCQGDSRIQVEAQATRAARRPARRNTDCAESRTGPSDRKNWIHGQSLTLADGTPTEIDCTNSELAETCARRGAREHAIET